MVSYKLNDRQVDNILQEVHSLKAFQNWWEKYKMGNFFFLPEMFFFFSLLKK